MALHRPLTAAIVANIDVPFLDVGEIDRHVGDAIVLVLPDGTCRATRVTSVTYFVVKDIPQQVVEALGASSLQDLLDQGAGLITPDSQVTMVDFDRAAIVTPSDIANTNAAGVDGPSEGNHAFARTVLCEGSGVVTNPGESAS